MRQHHFHDDKTWQYIRHLESLLGECHVFLKKAHHNDGCFERYKQYGSTARARTCDCKRLKLLEETREYERSIIKKEVSI